MGSRRVISIALLAGLVTAASTADAASLNVRGRGVARLRANADTQAASIKVIAPGRIQLQPFDATFRPVCLRKAKKPCVRFDRATGTWIVKRNVKFIYDGSEPYSLFLRANRGFNLGVLGTGVVQLRGVGNYVLNEEFFRYRGMLRLRLR